jgi:hypothetical protein
MNDALLTAVIALLACAAAGYYVTFPLRSRRWAQEDESRMRLANLEWRKNILLYGLKELEMDFRMKKLSEDDYQGQREAMLAQTAEIIEAVDLARREVLNRDIEDEIAKHRKDLSA